MYISNNIYTQKVRGTASSRPPKYAFMWHDIQIIGRGYAWRAKAAKAALIKAHNASEHLQSQKTKTKKEKKTHPLCPS